MLTNIMTYSAATLGLTWYPMQGTQSPYVQFQSSHRIEGVGRSSGVETGGSMNWVPELLGPPESGAKKFYARKEYATYQKLKN